MFNFDHKLDGELQHESHALQPCFKAAIDILSSDEEGPNSNHGGLDGMTVSTQELTGIIQALLDCKLFFGCMKPQSIKGFHCCPF